MPTPESTYYALRKTPVSEADLADAYLANALLGVWRENRCLYGMRKLWHEARRSGLEAGRDQVGRLMGILGIRGVLRDDHRTRTTEAAPDGAPRHPDFVKRESEMAGHVQLHRPRHSSRVSRSIAVAEADEREHERPAPRLLPEGNRPRHPLRRTAPRSTGRAEHPSTREPNWETAATFFARLQVYHWRAHIVTLPDLMRVLRLRPIG